MIPGLPPVSVNPSSSTDARSQAGGGIGDTNFYMGGNPNLAAIFGSKISPLIWIAAGVALFLLLRRRK